MKAALLTEALETVTLLLPEFFSVAVCASLCPTATVPKDRDAGLSSRAPGTTALPEAVIMIVPAVAALVEMVSLPTGFPAACGVNETVRAALWPGARLNGIAGAITWNEGSEDMAPAIVTVAEELFVRVSVSCLETPTTAAPKSRFMLAAEMEPLWVAGPPLGSAWQPAIANTAINRKKRPAKRSQRELRSIVLTLPSRTRVRWRENLECVPVVDSTKFKNYSYRAIAPR